MLYQLNCLQRIIYRLAFFLFQLCILNQLFSVMLPYLMRISFALAARFTQAFRATTLGRFAPYHCATTPRGSPLKARAPEPTPRYCRTPAPPLAFSGATNALARLRASMLVMLEEHTYEPR